MNENLIAVNVPNAVSIIIMGLIGFLALSLAHKAIAGRSSQPAG